VEQSYDRCVAVRKIAGIAWILKGVMQMRKQQLNVASRSERKEVVKSRWRCSKFGLKNFERISRAIVKLLDCAKALFKFFE
jgi:hypothetical protein